MYLKHPAFTLWRRFVRSVRLYHSYSILDFSFDFPLFHPPYAVAYFVVYKSVSRVMHLDLGYTYFLNISWTAVVHARKSVRIINYGACAINVGT